MDKLRAMGIFREVIRKNSFSKAAESLQLANSAVSRYVTELEQCLNVKLLYRTTRSLTLTEEGRLYLEKIDEILDRVEQLENLAVFSQQELRGTLRVTAPSFWGSFVLKPLMVEFMCSHPQVKIHSLFLNRKVSLVEEGYDLAVRIGNLPSSGLIARQVSMIKLKLAASPEYLQEYGIPLSPEELKDHQCLIDTIPDYQNKWAFSESGRNIMVPVEGQIHSNDPELLRDMALSGLGIVYLPEFFVKPAINSGKLVELLADKALGEIPVNLVFPPNKQMNPALRAFIDMIIDRIE
ncbi:LysR family transcriptional regulator [Psychromonas ossibalaenae]|uniref:LysR family transcriptional regulator n=1 Tax=Psychromonas ossibalaenae TaxID=444922 RepID=UPI00035D5C7C|nr:LysR family transcriptional regulator [Psychromonas ossibalaenae]